MATATATATAVDEIMLPLRALGNLLERLPEIPFFAKDASLRYIAANEAMLRLVGLRHPRELLGRTARDLFPAVASKRYEALDLRVLATGMPLHTWLDVVPRSGGGALWLQFTRYPLNTRDGAVCGVVAVARQLPLSVRKQAAYRRLARIARDLEEAPEQPLQLQHRARELGISASQLDRDFARVFAITPREFQTRCRIDRASLLLSRGNGVATVAHTCGFSDHSAFTRRFRSIVGIAPAAFARRAAQLALSATGPRQAPAAAAQRSRRR
jgi:PAS domain S-box-containing protein